MSLSSLLPLFGTMSVGFLGFLLIHLAADRPERRLLRQVSLFFWGALVFVVGIIALPLDATLRGQILSLLGILLSGAVALSSTTLLGNMLAGIMLRATRSFRLGDFIEVAGLQGRVSARGLIQLEIQTSDRGLQILPNLKLVSEPVRILPAEGSIIWAEVSLGYDVPRAQVEQTLIKAAEQAELSSPFVFITSLGDFSVVYRVHGQLANINTYLTSKARLYAFIMDELHNQEIEIVSPNFVNTRAIGTDKVLPVMAPQPSQDINVLSPEVEEQIFDKATEASDVELLEANLAKAQMTMETLASRTEMTPQQTERLEEQKSQVEALERKLDAAKAESEDGG